MSKPLPLGYEAPVYAIVFDTDADGVIIGEPLGSYVTGCPSPVGVVERGDNSDLVSLPAQIWFSSNIVYCSAIRWPNAPDTRLMWQWTTPGSVQMNARYFRSYPEALRAQQALRDTLQAYQPTRVVYVPEIEMAPGLMSPGLMFRDVPSEELKELMRSRARRYCDRVGIQLTYIREVHYSGLAG